MARHLELTISGRVLAFLASLAAAGAWLSADAHAALAASLLLAPLLIDALWKVGGWPRVRVEVRERRAQAGAAFAEQVRCTNLGARRAVHDLQLMEPRTSVRGGNRLLEHLPAQASATVELAARARGRGVQDARTFSVVSGYPFGFVRAWTTVTAPSRLVVEPARVPVPEQVLHGAAALATERLQSERLGSGEFHSLREHDAGDDVRLVHALRSAATGVLVRRLLHAENDAELRLVLDLRRGRGTRQGRMFERGLGLAAAVVDDALARGIALEWLVLHERPRRVHVGGRAAAESFLDFLAQVRPSRMFAADGLLHDWPAGVRLAWIAAGGRDFPERELFERRLLVVEP